MDDITLYTTAGCPHCARIRGELEQKHLRYKEIDVSTDRNALREVKEKYGADRVPVLVEGQSVTIGNRGMG